MSRHEDITARALDVQRKMDLHLHKSVLEQTVRALVRIEGIEKTKQILNWYNDKLESY